MAFGRRDTTPLEKRLGHRFKRLDLLQLSLTHRSWANEQGIPEHYERLEFLGDAVLQLICSDGLFRRYPQASEGELSALRAALVRASTLADLAREVPLGPYLRLGRGEEATGGRNRELLLASAFEAVLGALFADGGWRAARTFLEPLLRREADRALAGKRIKDDKSLLQEHAQARLGVTPSYRVVDESGPSHDRTFVVEVLLGDRAIGQGTGHNKRQAEQAAAHTALADPGWLEDEEDT